MGISYSKYLTHGKMKYYLKEEICNLLGNYPLEYTLLLNYLI